MILQYIPKSNETHPWSQNMTLEVDFEHLTHGAFFSNHKSNFKGCVLNL